MEDVWLYSPMHKSICKLIDEETLWGESICRVWFPNSDSIVKISKSNLKMIDSETDSEHEQNKIIFITAAAKIAELLEGSSQTIDERILLAPMESNVIPLPHQITALSRAISGDRIRFLLADEVGLGKTIEAGLILRELKLRGLAHRILVVSPKGIATQWISEMQIHFNEKFHLIMGEDIATIGRLSSGESSNPWTKFDQVVVSIDSVKPIEKRRGWSNERIAEYNRIRFEDLITSGWDLIIVDESHRLGGSTDQVARYKLGQGLAESSPYLLLLSATPHQGKTDAFHRLVSLLDPKAFPDVESVSRERVSPFVIRTEKRNAIDVHGKQLFKPRRTEMYPIRWLAHHNLQKNLYESVTDYVRDGYNQAMKEKKHHIGFLMILMQRLVVSSTRAIRTTLEKRIEVLSSQKVFVEENSENLELELETIYDMDGQELLDELLVSHVAALENEISLVEMILFNAIQCEQFGPDAKAENLMDWIYRLQSEENETNLKILIFTEFVSTQKMLVDFLETRGISVVCLNGSMSIDERKEVQDSFRNASRVLISTDAGGEGLNLQFCHVVINYDIPWNPMRLEQRIGRVDRIGQNKVVRAINFIFEDSVEFRVREVLEEKLSVIFHEFGIDKTGDVLDSAQAGEIYEKMFTSVILNPDNIDEVTQKTVDNIKQEVKEIKENSVINEISDNPDLQSVERLRNHPLPHWLERMTISYLESHGGSAEQKNSCWNLIWPDGTKNLKVVFSYSDVELYDAKLLNLENSSIRELTLNLPQIVSAQPVPFVSIKDLPANISGYWGLYEIRLSLTGMQVQTSLRIPSTIRRFISVFIDKEDKVFIPTARHIWNTITDSKISFLGTLSLSESKNAFERLRNVAEEAGKDLFDELIYVHSNILENESERADFAFKYRRKSNKRIGLLEVRNYRNKKLEKDYLTWQNDLKLASQIIPEIRPLIIIKIGEGEMYE